MTGAAAPAAGGLALERHDRLDATDLASEWTALAERAGNVFTTWEWASAWWDHFGEGRPLLIGAARRTDGRLAAIVPLYLSATRPVRTVRFVGRGPADQLGPVCAAADRPAAADLLLSLLDQRPGRWQLFLGDELEGEVGWAALLGAKILRREPSPVLRIDGMSWDELLASRSSNFREQVRRRERRLAREHALHFRLAEAPDRIEADLDAFHALHRARWRGGSSELLAGAGHAFQRDFAMRAAERGWLRLWFLELDGRPVAAWQGFRFAGVESYYQAGRDPAWDSHAVGFVLMAHSVREAMNDGMREYRLLRGGEAYKARFANADPGLETIALSRGVAGGAAAAAARLASRLPPGARSRLSRLAG